MVKEKIVLIMVSLLCALQVHASAEMYAQGILQKTKNAELISEWIDHYIKVEAEKIQRVKKVFSANGDIQLSVMRSAQVCIKALKELKKARKHTGLLQNIVTTNSSEKYSPFKTNFTDKELDAHIKFEYGQALEGYIIGLSKKGASSLPYMDLYVSADCALLTFNNLKKEFDNIQSLEKKIAIKRAAPCAPNPDGL